MSRSSTVGGLLLFVAVGVVLSLYGPAMPEFRERFGISTGDSALALSAHFAGAIVGIAGWALLDRRLGTGRLLRRAAVLLVAGSIGLALAPVWPVVLAAAALVGVGFGVLVVALNALFAAGFGDRGAAMLNLLGASFGAGAILGPLALAATGGFRGPFLGGAVLVVASLPLMRDVQRCPAPERPAGSARPAPVLIGGFVLLYVLYVGVESGVGGWEATSLLAHGTGEAAAANWTAGYWAAITAGRLLAVPLAMQIAPPRLVAGSLLLAAASLTLAHTPPLAPFAYTLTGLVLAPVFPTGLAWLAAAAPATRASTALVIAGAQLGGVVLPAVIGRLIDAGSPAVIPSALLAAALACLGTALLLRRSAANL